ncbi:TcaA NTF2-like domain-containing protein [Planococcus alpniumensis]|uniref:TcaA NTF2-like domain-containing protein n=1 Tax=Planococcus alpniumensis TaxID=2708345 RepID=UPI001B8BDBD0|nr:hypothetical protein [Planococcus sp. MSAK28401]
MKTFCTNCGHENDQANQVCVECGKPLSKDKLKANSPAPKKNKEPLSLKTKILGAVGILLIASLVGVYSWGTKTASAETAVSKFFEALENEDAKSLAKQVQLSNGKKMTTKEAAAFIEEYGDITPYELEDVANVEKNGKVMGVFNAHRVVIPVQKVSFYFADEGLSLSLNGELVEESKAKDDEYIFSGITPGYHQAEFIYEGEFAEFTYPFDLYVGLNRASSEPEEIYEELPLTSVVFALDTFVVDTPEANKVVIGEKEIPVNEMGETDEIGPLLMDGSVTAQAQVDFPWGTQLSEPVKITSGYENLDFTGLDEKHQPALIEQLKVFAEEYVEAFAKRDEAVFTSVEKDQLAVFKEDFKWMKEYENHFMGALTEVGIDEDSIAILDDGKTLELSAELLIDGAEYYVSDTPEAEEIIKDVSMNFVYDQDEEKWMVTSYNDDIWMYDVAPTKTVEGSKKMHKSSGTSKTAVEEESEEESEEDTGGFADSDETVEWFMSDYNDASVAAINQGDYSVVSEFVLKGSPKAKEQSAFVDSMYEKGITEEHLDTTLENIESVGGKYYEVTTIETFIIHGTEKSSEKTYRTVTKITEEADGLQVYELISTKEI